MFRRSIVALVAVLALIAPAGSTMAAPVAVAPPDTPAGRQLAWVLDASGRAPVADAELRKHLSAAFLDAVGGTAGMNGLFTQTGPLALREVLSSGPARVEAVTAGTAKTFATKVVLDDAGLIAGLFLSLYVAAPTSWSALDSRLRALAPRASFAVSEIGADGRCRTIHAVGGTTLRPLGSVFKLYVLGALNDAVAAGRASWNEPLAIRDEWKSLPSGELQNEPAGTTLPLSRYADLMISNSDNTATDHLIHRLTRSAVERQLVAFGHDAPRVTTPLLTTREFFALKLVAYPTLANVYTTLPRVVRPLVLPAIGRLPLGSAEAWTTPRALDTVEWFGSPADVCDAYAGLQRQAGRPGGEPVAHALSISDGAIALNRGTFPEIWHKGGSEVGVFDLTYRVRTAGGRSLVVSILLSNPDAAFVDATVAPEAQALVRGALEMAR